MARRCTILAAALALSGAASAQTEQPGLYLFQIPSVRGSREVLSPGAAVQADLHVRDPEHFLRRLGATGVSVVSVEDKRVRIAAGADETLTGGPLTAHRAASFVMDFEQASVAELIDTLRSAHGSRPSIAELIRFVDVRIASKSYRRSFDIASQVARSREGDCTEHAVLLAALARATERPARVVLGILLADAPENVSAFGHAWTEIHDGESWRIADATRPETQLPAAQLRYVPLMVLANEGPGYALELFELAALYPARIEGVRPAGSTALNGR